MHPAKLLSLVVGIRLGVARITFRASDVGSAKYVRSLGTPVRRKQSLVASGSEVGIALVYADDS
jgi:hypothetical protein